jgi:hypothetical protein
MEDQALEDPLFELALLGPFTQKKLPTDYTIRPLEVKDCHKGFHDCLSQLTTVGTVTFEEFKGNSSNKSVIKNNSID